MPLFLPQAPLPAVSVSVSPDQDAELTSPSGKITLRIPRGAVAAPLKVDLVERPPLGSTGMRFVRLFELNATDLASGQPVTSFQKDLTITLLHDAEELRGLDVRSLRLYSLDEKTRQWVPVAGVYDRSRRILTAATNHFTQYGEQGNPEISGPGRVMAAQVNLHSGTATFAYPFELPPGPGGFRPKLEMTYNSSVAGEMKNKRATGSWAGIGWTLHLGRISYEPATRQYFLDLNGGSYELYATGTPPVWRTSPEQYFKINQSGNTWEVWDREGTYYRFGGTADSEQFTGSGLQTYYYRFDLSLIRDVNGNEAAIAYDRDIFDVDLGEQVLTRVRASYPRSIAYGNIQVLFNSAWYENDPTDGHLRRDSPKSYGPTNPAPLVMEVRQLDSIEVKVTAPATALVKKYVFEYQTTDRQYVSDYGGTYYAGKHKLVRVAEAGADGASQLPWMTFTYQDLETYRHGTDPSELDYTGNPGNPASLSLPHLTAVDSGYGGSVNFAYTQIPANTTNNIWTREAVTTRTIIPGIGPNQTYSYGYTGNPRYRGNGWGQQYRGFDQVRETDAAGNYSDRFFYTTGVAGGKDAERLTGKEHRTQWYSNSGAMLREKTYDWSWVSTSPDMDVMSTWTTDLIGGGLYFTPYGVATRSGDLYATDSLANNPYSSRVFKLDLHGSVVTTWGGYGILDRPKGVAAGPDGYVYVVDQGNKLVKKYTSSGVFVTSFGSWGWGPGQWMEPWGIAVSSDGYVYVTDAYQMMSHKVLKFTTSGYFVTEWGTYGYQYGELNYPYGVAVSSNGQDIYVADWGNGRVQKFNSSGQFVGSWSPSGAPRGIAVSPDGYVYVTTSSNFIERYNSYGIFVRRWGGGPPGPVVFNPIDITAGDTAFYFTEEGLIKEISYNGRVQLNQTDDTAIDPVNGNRTSRTRYVYDSYGNVITEYFDGDLFTVADDRTTNRLFYPNTAANILSKPAQETVFSSSGQVKETLYYYDGANNNWAAPPVKGNLTRLEQKKDASSSVSSYFTYDSYSNMLTSQDPRGQTTTWTYETTHHTYPQTKTLPVAGLSESYTYEGGTDNRLTKTDVNGLTTEYKYDTFKRLTKVIKPKAKPSDPADSEASPSIEYRYNNWGVLNQQNLETRTRVAGTDYIWSKQYFDGLGRVVQTQARGETGHTAIPSTTAFSNRGLVDREYVSQDVTPEVTVYQPPLGSWKYTSFTYDGLDRVLVQTKPDATTIRHDYSMAWRDEATNERGYLKRYYQDASQQLAKVEELNASQQVYATTLYTYDVLGNLTQVRDNAGNTTAMTFDWLSRKTQMVDRDMGAWRYTWDNSGNLATQTDARNQTITLAYDGINRLAGKTYPAGSGMTNVVYTYDAFEAGVNYGKGKRTGMTDALGVTAYKYDGRGRPSEEKRTVDAVDYTTLFVYDGADRTAAITYPTGEVVTAGYNLRGQPNTLSGSTVGNLVTATSYNALGAAARIDLASGRRTTFTYWGLDYPGGYWGRLREIKDDRSDGSDIRQQLTFTWDAAGNLTQRARAAVAPDPAETETFTYDFLDRLTGVSGPYSETYAYNQIGNITSRGGLAYTYGSSRPHAVTRVGTTDYTYDANGSMLTGDGRTITWDVENRPVQVVKAGVTSTFVYDGDGKRGKKTEGGLATLYLNKYYEKTGSEITTSYYLGEKLVAIRKGSDLRYIHQDHLTGTALTTDAVGAMVGSVMKYFPYGVARSGDVPTERKFTGQRLDSTGLYYYGARYYDPAIARFISADTIVPDPRNPQALNRYSYVLNNPLRYTDPSGHGIQVFFVVLLAALNVAAIVYDFYQFSEEPTPENALWMALDFFDPSPIPMGPIAGFAKRAAKQGAKEAGEQAAKETGKEVAGRAVKESGALGKPLRELNETNFRENLLRWTDKTPEAVKGKQAHHVFPLSPHLRQFFEQAGINVNHPKYGTWVDNVHQRWSNQYNDRWREFFTRNPSPTENEIKAFAKELAGEFRFEVHFQSIQSEGDRVRGLL